MFCISRGRSCFEIPLFAQASSQGTFLSFLRRARGFRDFFVLFCFRRQLALKVVSTYVPVGRQVMNNRSKYPWCRRLRFQTWSNIFYSFASRSTVMNMNPGVMLAGRLFFIFLSTVFGHFFQPSPYLISPNKRIQNCRAVTSSSRRPCDVKAGYLIARRKLSSKSQYSSILYSFSCFGYL